MCALCRAIRSLLAALPAVAQAQAFPTISIRPARSTDPRDARFEVWPNGDLIVRAFPVDRLLSYAYDFPANPSSRISMLPNWTFSEKYDIEANAPANTIPPSLQDGEVRGRIRANGSRITRRSFRARDAG